MRTITFRDITFQKKFVLSDTSFHKRIMARHQKRKHNLFGLPLMMFKGAGRIFPRKVDILVLFDLIFHNRSVHFSSVLLKKVQAITRLFSQPGAEKQMIRTGVPGSPANNRIVPGTYDLTIPGLFTIKQVPVSKSPIYSFPAHVFYRTENMITLKKEVQKIFSGKVPVSYIQGAYNILISARAVNTQRAMNTQILNNSPVNNNFFLAGTVNDRIFNYPSAYNILANILTSTGIVESHILNYTKTAHSKFVSVRAVNNQTSNYLSACSIFTPIRTVNNRVSNYQQTLFNTFQDSGIIHNQVLNYPTTAKPQMRLINSALRDISRSIPVQNIERTDTIQAFYGNKTLFNENAGIFHTRADSFQRQTGRNFLDGKIEMIQSIMGSNTQISRQVSRWTKDIYSKFNFLAQNVDFRFTSTPWQVETVIKVEEPANNIAAGPADIVFRKSQIYNASDDTKKQLSGRTALAKAGEDNLKKSNSLQEKLDGIDSIANKVYRLLERRLLIEKEKRGAQVNG